MVRLAQGNTACGERINLCFIECSHKRVVACANIFFLRGISGAQQVQNTLGCREFVANTRVLVKFTTQLVQAKNGRLGKNQIVHVDSSN